MLCSKRHCFRRALETLYKYRNIQKISAYQLDLSTWLRHFYHLCSTFILLHPPVYNYTYGYVISNISVSVLS
jgi:hypothetical protein